MRLVLGLPNIINDRVLEFGPLYNWYNKVTPSWVWWFNDMTIPKMFQIVGTTVTPMNPNPAHDPIILCENIGFHSVNKSISDFNLL